MRLIDADILRFYLNTRFFHDVRDKDIVCETINAQPTIDPVQKGHWDNVDETPYIRKHFNVVCCSVCRKKGYTAWNYCPNCGAKMKGAD